MRCSKILTLNGKERNMTLNKIAGVQAIFVSPPATRKKIFKPCIVYTSNTRCEVVRATTLYDASCLA